MRTTLVAALIAIVALAGPVYGEVRDQARIFSTDKVAEANTIIREIKSRFGRTVTIETFAEIPVEKKAAFDVAIKNPDQKAKFYQEWLRERAKVDGVKGIFVLVCMKPGHIRIDQDADTEKHDFPDAEAREVHKGLTEDFKAHKYDEGLITAVRAIETSIQSKKGLKTAPIVAQPASKPYAPPPAPKESSWMSWLCPILAIVAGVWIVVAVIKGLMGAGRSAMGGGGPTGGPGYAPGYGGGGGGGFMQTFLGGMVGSMAGNWMYNSFFGGGHHGGPSFDNPAFGGDPNYGGNPDYGRGNDDDFSGGSGGDVDTSGGDMGGGGDFDAGGSDTGGGGFFGGGDGGGDFGGGGGDFGGGDGGDF